MSDNLELVAAALAHEIKNPLTLVKANIELLESKEEKNETRNSYKLIKTELDKINDLIIEFININKPVDQYSADLVYIEDILDELINKYTRVYNGNINFVLTQQKVEHVVIGNEKSLTVLFDNIIKNAIEAIKEKGLIQIDILNKDKSLVVSIIDNGPGIAKDLEEKVLEEYFTTKPYGNGLGLWICKKIANDHNAQFKIGNNKGGGCKVVVDFGMVF